MRTKPQAGRNDMDVDLTTQNNEPHSKPEVREDPMRRPKSKQLRKRFNLAMHDIVSSVEQEEVN